MIPDDDLSELERLAKEKVGTILAKPRVDADKLLSLITELRQLRKVYVAANAWNLARIARYRELPASEAALHTLGRSTLDLIDALAAIGGGK